MPFDYSKITSKLSDIELNSLNNAETYVSSVMPKDDVHGFGHVWRVVINCVDFIHLFDIDTGTSDRRPFQPFILLFAAWFHDIGRTKEELLKKNHSLISGDMTREYISHHPDCIPIFNLTNVPIHNPKHEARTIIVKENQERTIEHIIECIESHSFSAGRQQNSLEAQLLSDADKIDALGSIGIYRAACFQQDNGTGIEGLIQHFHEKLLILDEKIHTHVGKEFAKRRIKKMREYLKDLEEETRLIKK